MISIIVPVYQRKIFIERLINSILKQTYVNFELIIVDDGSTDGTSEICDNYARVDYRIKVIHQKNMGSLNARAKGVEIAQGEYICFVDSDDIIDENYLQMLFESIQKKHVDILISQFDIVYESGEKNKVFEYRDRIELNSESALIEMIDRRLFGWELVGKLYKSTLIKKYRFHNNLVYAEDLVTNWELFHMTNNIGYVPYVGYHYYRHDNNITNNVRVRRKAYVQSLGMLIDCKYGKSLSWEKLLNLMEKMLYETLIPWIFSREPLDEDYYELFKILKKVENEKEENNYQKSSYSPSISEDGNAIREEYINKCRQLIKDIQIYRCNCKDLYIFGNGVWARRVSKLLNYASIDFKGYVVSDLNHKKKDWDYQIEFKELKKDEGVIICVSDNKQDEILEALNRLNEGIKPFVVKEKEVIKISENIL